jgi:hypothetical protein
MAVAGNRTIAVQNMDYLSRLPEICVFVPIAESGFLIDLGFEHSKMYGDVMGWICMRGVHSDMCSEQFTWVFVMGL